MSVEKQKFDFNSPQVQKQVEEIQQGAFMRQGTMLAFPLNFPGQSTAIAPDESHITALDATPEGIVYGGTSGRQVHIITGMFYGASGMVFDMKVVADAHHCAAVCCGKQKLAAFVNGPDGGRIFETPLLPLATDLIQEWSFRRPEFADLGAAVPGEPVLHAVADLPHEQVFGVTPQHLFRFDFASGKCEVLAEMPGRGRLAVDSSGNIVGPDDAGHVWTYNPRAAALHRRAVKLPGGVWASETVMWARDPRQGLLYTADGTGTLYSYLAGRGFSSPLGKTLLAPVGPMAVTFDGRLFGFCGDGIGKMFCYDPGHKQVIDLGVALSIFERRRYGYVFGDAVIGRDGEVVFGEDDNLGHMWLYFPRVQATA